VSRGDGSVYRGLWLGTVNKCVCRVCSASSQFILLGVREVGKIPEIEGVRKAVNRDKSSMTEFTGSVGVEFPVLWVIVPSSSFEPCVAHSKARSIIPHSADPEHGHSPWPCDVIPRDYHKTYPNSRVRPHLPPPPTHVNYQKNLSTSRHPLRSLILCKFRQRLHFANGTFAPGVCFRLSI
jgi:hypothetical protein